MRKPDQTPEADDRGEFQRDKLGIKGTRDRIMEQGERGEIPEAFTHIVSEIAKLTGQTPSSIIKPSTIEHFNSVQMKVNQFIDSYNGRRNVLTPKDIEFLKSLLDELVAERNYRADEIEDLAEATEIERELLPLPVYENHCIDGRTALVYTFGIVGKVRGVGATALPAGDMRECILSETGEMVIIPGSNLARMIDKSLEQNKTITQVLDSHLACAARKRWETARGNEWPDDGLMVDVLRKKKMGEAMKNYSAGKGQVLPIQISFDVHNGFLHMGLETDPSLQAAKKAGGFTKDVLTDLQKKGQIFSTENLAMSPHIQDLFRSAYEQFDPKPDLKTLYKVTGIQFWKALKEMAPKILPFIKKSLAKIYPDMQDVAEIQQRAMLLLASAFSGFCNNANGKYPYGEHEEAFISVTKRDFKPFKEYMAFAVASSDTQNVPGNVVFASEIVRTNRKVGRAQQHMDKYGSKEEFVKAPIAVMVKEIVDIEDDAQPIDWEKIEKIDWEFVRGIDWISMDSGEFQQHLIERGCFDMRIAKAADNLRKNMAALCNYNTESASEILEGRLIPFPVLVDQSRRFRVLIPFHFKGVIKQ